MFKKRIRSIFAVLSLAFSLNAYSAESDTEANQTLAEKDKRYWEVNPLEGAEEPKVLSIGLRQPEGPVWIPLHNALYFSDVRGEATYRFTLPDTFEKYRSPTGQANGMAVMNGNELYMCEVLNRRLTKMLLPADPDTPPPEPEVVFDGWPGTGSREGRFNQTNDIIIRSDGNVYFTDPNYRKVETDTLGFTAVYRIDPKGELSIVTKELYPNGIALSPEEDILYVTNRASIWKFPLSEDGMPGEGSEFIRTNGSVDGFAVDIAGNLYTTSKGIEVYSRDGHRWGSLGIGGSNCTFGGEDMRILFITTKGGIAWTELLIPGLP